MKHLKIYIGCAIASLISVTGSAQAVANPSVIAPPASNTALVKPRGFIGAHMRCYDDAAQYICGGTDVGTTWVFSENIEGLQINGIIEKVVITGA